MSASVGNGKPTSLIISFSETNRDPRVYRQVEHLKGRFDLTVAGFGNLDIEGVKHLEMSGIGGSASRKLSRFLQLERGKYLDYLRSTYDFGEVEAAVKRGFDLIIANDVETLPLAIGGAPGNKVLLDAHEFSPRQIEHQWTWRHLYQPLMEWLCSGYLKKCDAMVTVSNGIAKEYNRVYGVSPRVITNAPKFFDLHPGKPESGKVKMIHHGYANALRPMDDLIEVMDHVDGRFSLDLFLIPRDRKYYGKLERKVASRKNVRLMKPIEMMDLVPVANAYDIGLFLQRPLNFNFEQSLPNKFFEFIQSRLMLCVGPLPEMERIVKEFDLGIVSRDYEPINMAEELNLLTEERLWHHKQQSSKAAKVHCAEENMKVLDQVIDGMMGYNLSKAP